MLHGVLGLSVAISVVCRMCFLFLWFSAVSARISRFFWGGVGG